MFTGVTMHKNILGGTVFVLGVFLLFDLMKMRQRREGQRADMWIRYGMLAIGGWLLITCNSLTSIICLLLAFVLLSSLGGMFPMNMPKRALLTWSSIIAVVVTLLVCAGGAGNVSEFFGRDTTLSGRTWIWDLVEQQHVNPIFGCGFYSFWSTEGAQEISDLFKGTLSTVHNGFLEMYLDGGAVGLSLLILLLLVWGRRSVRQMLEGTVEGRLAVTFWLLAIVRNFSETEYFRFTPLWFTLLLLMIEYPQACERTTFVQSSQGVGSLSAV